jgi:hypothetical protein
MRGGWVVLEILSRRKCWDAGFDVPGAHLESIGEKLEQDSGCCRVIQGFNGALSKVGTR